ncbi:MAG: AsmA family protein [Planctomycetes bacterium]|nr:AsmA family protein [Planctomycetota bacterium]
MKKIVKKTLSIAGIVILAILALILILFTMFGNQAIKVGIETGATMALKVGVSVKDVNLSLFGGKFELAGLKIENPAGYQHTEFLTLDKVTVALKMSSLLSDTIEIEKIQMDNIQLTLEQKGVTTNNLQEILSALPKSEEKAPQPEAAPKAEEKAGKKMLIRELVINGVEVKVKLLPTLRLNPIVLKDLGSDRPINIAELTAQILKAIAGGIAEQGKDLLPLDMINSIGSGLAEQGKKILETAGQAGEGILKGAGDVGKGASDALKGIIQKKD